MIENINCFELNGKNWYLHPIHKKYACTEIGEVIYKKRRY